MTEILTNARDRRAAIARRAVAHELSAEYHRHRGVQFGVAATIVSAIVGSAVFLAVARALGMQETTISVPSAGWERGALGVFALLSVLSPVLTGLQAYLDHPTQAGKHLVSAAEYFRLSDRLDTFLGRYGDVPLAGEQLESALKELDDISRTEAAVRRDSISLTERALTDAAARLGAKGARVARE